MALNNIIIIIIMQQVFSRMLLSLQPAENIDFLSVPPPQALSTFPPKVYLKSHGYLCAGHNLLLL